ncbi:hypothetical protein B0A48_09686 [Cryoendolithus antarcticus]|uniref:Uncharacterized protein n=1 Tax=Cryoendolithus antarcticus TaxID=1507870 RepID=A0A1V8T0S3_9PEZI|nr:hypothetical protein B0A48_09686 [Cryoendolithus antarcticus]
MNRTTKRSPTMPVSRTLRRRAIYFAQASPQAKIRTCNDYKAIDHVDKYESDDYDLREDMLCLYVLHKVTHYHDYDYDYDDNSDYYHSDDDDDYYHSNYHTNYHPKDDDDDDDDDNNHDH